MDARDYQEQVQVGKSLEEWKGDPCYALVFDTVRDTILQRFTEASAGDADGVYELKLMLSATKMVEAAVAEFIQRGEMAAHKLKKLRTDEERQQARK